MQCPRVWLLLLLLATALCHGHEERIQALRDAVKETPRSFDAHWRLASELAAANAPEEALRHVEVCLRVRPQDEAAWAEHTRLKGLRRGAQVLSPEQQGQSEEGVNVTEGRTKRGKVGDGKAENISTSQWVVPRILFDDPTPAGYQQIFADPLCPCHRAARDILAAYQDIFTHISVQRGWRTLPFTIKDLERLLQVASETVALLRAHLDAKADGLKLRQVDGSAQDFLWQVKGNPRVDLPNQNYTFVYEVLKGVVHATLQDAHGYVEGIDQEMVSRFVDAHPFVSGFLRPAVSKS